VEDRIDGLVASLAWGIGGVVAQKNPELDRDDLPVEAPDAPQEEKQEGEAVAEEAPEENRVNFTPAQIDSLTRQIQAALLRQAKRSRRTGIALPRKETVVQNISFEELSQALKGIHVWVRTDLMTDVAERRILLDPESVARDVFMAVQKSKDGI
jgi:hypothetical protein